MRDVENTERVYGGVSAAQRREERRGRLIKAAGELLATDGIDDLTVRKVAAAAGLSPRFVYEGFTDLEDLEAVGLRRRRRGVRDEHPDQSRRGRGSPA